MSKKRKKRKLLKKIRQKSHKKNNTAKNRYWVRTGIFVHHHIVNRCRGGKSANSNLLLFEHNREKAWHDLFGNYSFREVAIRLLTEMIVIRGDKRASWIFLFGDKDNEEVARLLLRTARLKKRC